MRNTVPIEFSKPFYILVFLLALILGSERIFASVTYLKDVRSHLQLLQLNANEQISIKNQSQKVYDEIYAHSEVKMRYFNNPDLNPSLRIASLMTNANDPSLFLANLTQVTLDLRDLHQSISWPVPFSCFRSFVPITLSYAKTDSEIKPVISSFFTSVIDNELIRKEVESLLKSVPKGAEVVAVDQKEIKNALAEVARYGAGSNESAYQHEALWAVTYISHEARDLPIHDNLSLEIRDPETNTTRTVSLPYLVKKKSRLPNPHRSILSRVESSFNYKFFFWKPYSPP